MVGHLCNKIHTFLQKQLRNKGTAVNTHMLNIKKTVFFELFNSTIKKITEQGRPDQHFSYLSPVAHFNYTYNAYCSANTAQTLFIFICLNLSLKTFYPRFVLSP